VFPNEKSKLGLDFKDHNYVHTLYQKLQMMIWQDIFQLKRNNEDKINGLDCEIKWNREWWHKIKSTRSGSTSLVTRHQMV